MTAPAEQATSASAPVRLDFAGGWTDVPPFSATEGGAVVAAAIGLRTHARVVCSGQDLRLVSEDLDDELTLPGNANVAGRGRVDIRFAQDRDGELYVITKSDGMIRKIVGFR